MIIPGFRPLAVTCPKIACPPPQGKVTSRGFDLEVGGQLAAGWQLAAGYAFNQTRDQTVGGVYGGNMQGLLRNAMLTLRGKF